MTREEFWAKSLFECGLLKTRGSTLSHAAEAADRYLAEYDKRFTAPPAEAFSLEDLPSFDDVDEECVVEGARVSLEYGSAEGQFYLIARSDSLSSPKYYSNAATKGDARIWYDVQGKDYIAEMLIDVDPGVDHGEDSDLV